MVVDKFTVEVDAPGWDYRPGETISGRVLLDVSDDQRATEILVRFFGEAKTHFQITKNTTTSSKTYSSVEYLFDVPMTVFGGNQILQPITPGKHSYPFAFTVPDKRFPEPVELTDGHIKYGIEACLTSGIKDETMRTDIVPIFFDTNVSLSDFPLAGIPLVVEESYVFDNTCCCRKGNPVTIQTSTASQAYRLGETVVTNVSIHNTGSKPISRVTAALVQVWNMIGGKREKTLTLSLAAQGREGILAGATALMEFSFEIPTDVPVSMEGYKIIKMTYGVQVEAAVQDEGMKTQSFKVLHPILLASKARPDLPLEKTHEVLRRNHQRKKIYRMVLGGYELVLDYNKSNN